MTRSLIALLVLAACGGPARPPAAQPIRGASDLDPRFVDAVRSAGAHYREWARLDDHLRQAPTLCAAPVMGPSEPTLRRSAAASGPHGQKLYYLWPSSTAVYTSGAAVPDGFAVVKESFAAVAAGGALTAGDRTDLFVMTKVGAGEGTDLGWVYGTVAPDGTVTSAGRVASCMGCHDRDGRHERLFGVAPHGG